MNDAKTEINFKAITRNIKSIRAKTPCILLCAVVKPEIAKVIHPHVDFFATMRIQEAVQLRSVVTKPILLLAPCEDFQTAIAHDITLSVGSMHEMHAIAKASAHGKINVHIEVNTGLNRFGINTLWQLRTIFGIASRHDIQITGLYTQISSSKQTELQLRRFAPFRAMIKRFHPRAIIHADTAHFDMVRVGRALLENSTTIRAKVIAVQNIKTSDNVGYNETFTATKPMVVGIVNCGYSQGEILIGKTKCQMLSHCENTIFIDVTDIKNPLGKSVTIFKNL